LPLEKTRYIWMNGKLVPWDEAKIHILTHALHYGSGVFEGVRCYLTPQGPAVFRLEEHLQRLFNSAETYHMKIPYTLQELAGAVKELIKANGLRECYIRPIAYRGYGEMGLSPLTSPVEVAIAAWPWGVYLGEEGLKNGVRATVSSYRRIASDALPLKAKATGQYLNSILAKVEALNRGYHEAIMLDSRGFVAEGPGENIFIVKHGRLQTPPEEAGILLGITRDSVMRIAENLHYTVEEKDITQQMLREADEAFFTGTAAEVTPIREVDRQPIGTGKPGPITVRLQREFKEIVQGKNPEYRCWLSFVEET